MTHRVLGFVLVFLSILILPYWIYIPVLFIAVIFFPFYWEGIYLAFLIDIVHGSGIGNFPFLVSPFAFSVLVTLIVLLPLRERLRPYV